MEKTTMRRNVNIAYSGIHGCYWMIFAVINSFSSIFLLSRGYSNWEIGTILSIGNILAVLLQPVIANFADRSKRVSVYQIMGLLSTVVIGLSLCLLAFKAKSAVLSVTYVLIFMTMVLLQPFCNALIFDFEKVGIPTNFGFCRSIGSFAYAVMCMILGVLVHNMGTKILPIAAIFITLGFMLAIVRISKLYGKARGEFEGEMDSSLPFENKGKDISFKEFIGNHKIFIAINLGVLGIYFADAIINVYMAQIVENVGGNSKDVGKVFSILAFLEVPTLMFFNKLRKKFSCRKMLCFSALAFILWVGICRFAGSVTTILLAQLVQPFAFALFMPSMVHFIDENMSEGEAIRGQTMFTTFTTTAGIFASFFGGIALDLKGATFLLSTGLLATVIGAAIIIASVGKRREPR